MKKLGTVCVVLGLVLSASAFAQDRAVFGCHKIIGKRWNGTLVDAQVFADSTGKLTLTILSCSGVLNWGCGNGMDNLINESFTVEGSAATGFSGEGASLLPDAQAGTVTLTTPQITSVFMSGESCWTAPVTP